MNENDSIFTGTQNDYMKIVECFEKKSGLSGINYEIKERINGQYLIISIINPTERFFSLLSSCKKELFKENNNAIKATIIKRNNAGILKGPEVKLFIKVLAESLTINRYSFSDDFFSRYIMSVSGAEDKIVSASNNIVLGRRGSGKSSLLLYSMHDREKNNKPCIWIDMQTYAQRSDLLVILDLFKDIINQVKNCLVNNVLVDVLLAKIETLMAKKENMQPIDIKVLLPEMKRLFSNNIVNNDDICIFLDDFHVVDQKLQPLLIQTIYSFCRGNKAYIKVSAIETFTKLYDSISRTGIEIPHDAQLINLDYNLTIADKANIHISSILDAHADYCGLPSVRAICLDNDVLSRLVWVAAGVPRDALNILSLALSKASIKNQKRITVTNINTAASELINDKLKDIVYNSSEEIQDVKLVLEDIKDFCLKQNKKNAFLAEILNENTVYQIIRKLIDMRFLHIVNEGITPGEAGRKYLALILDYGFYIGIRAAKSIDLYNKKTDVPNYRVLRKLPIYDYSVWIER